MGNSSFYQGGGNPLDAQNPQLVPNTYRPTSAANGVLSFQSPADAIAANPRVAGTCAITLSGTPTTGHTLELVVTNNVLPGGSVTISQAETTSHSLAETGEQLAAAVNNNSVLQQHDIYATSFNGVVTLNQLGPLSLFTTLSQTGDTDVSLAFANSGALTGGSGPAVPMNSFTATLGVSTSKFIYGFPVSLAYPQLSALVSAGLPLK